MSQFISAILRHADTLQSAFGYGWLNYYDAMNNGLRVPPTTPANCDYTPVPDVNFPTCLPVRSDGFDAWAGDPCLSESGRMTAVAVGQHMARLKLTPDVFGRRIFCSPSYAAVETASCLADGICGAYNETIDLCVEYGLFVYPSRYRTMPSLLSAKELYTYCSKRVDTSYKPYVKMEKLYVKEALINFYSRSNNVANYLLKHQKAKFTLIVAHGSNMEGICRTIRQMPVLDEANFTRCVEGIPFLADACLGEDRAGTKSVWKSAESPLLRFSQVGNEKQEDWSWLNLDEAKLKQKFK